MMAYLMVVKRKNNKAEDIDENKLEYLLFKIESFWSNLQKVLLGLITVGITGLVVLVLDTQKEVISISKDLEQLNKNYNRDFEIRDAAISNLRELMNIQIDEIRDLKLRTKKLEEARIK